MCKQKIRIAHIMGKMVSGGVESVVINYYKNIDKENISDEEKFTKLMIGYSFDDYTEKDWKDMA